MTNNLIARNWGSGVRVDGGSATVVNCTVADNEEWGVIISATGSVKNCIAWGNGAGGVSGAYTTTYSDVQGELPPGPGNLNIDPRFVSSVSNDYHLMSLSGSWHNDANGGSGGWVTDTLHSACIDMGDSTDTGWGVEPAPNGGCINMGAYGGTGLASKYYAWPPPIGPAVTNLGAALLRRDSAKLVGEVLETGSTNGYCWTWFYYWPDGGSPTSIVRQALQNGVFETVVSGLAAGTTYCYKVLVSNDTGTAWSGEKLFSTLSSGSLNWYVAPDGDSTEGTAWTTAFTDIDDALELAVVAGDTICMKYGTWSNAESLTITDLPGVVIKGGYAGNDVGGLPGETNGATVLTRDAAEDVRILYAANCTVTLERVTIEGGYLTPYSETTCGGGMYFTNGLFTLRNAVVNYNRIRKTGGDYGDEWGGAIYAVNGALHLYDTIVSSNSLDSSSGNHNSAYGGAIYCRGVDVFATNCTFDFNYADTYSGFGNNGHGYGGAIYMNGGGGEFFDCSLYSNWTYGVCSADGGAICAWGVNYLVVESCTLSSHSRPNVTEWCADS